MANTNGAPGASIFDTKIAAASTYGFLLAVGKVVTAGNAASVYLSRPYSTATSQVAVRNTDLGAAITNPTTRPQLSDTDAATYTQRPTWPARTAGTPPVADLSRTAASPRSGHRRGTR